MAMAPTDPAKAPSPTACSSPASPGTPSFRRMQPPPIYNTIADAIGNTPLIRMHRVPRMLGMECEVLGKCEFLNPGGSVKDRIAREMVDGALRDGRIKSGADRVVEPTSGNTGIGLAMMGAVRGIDVVIAMPNKMSNEKATVLGALGAKVVRTPTSVAFDDPASHITLSHNMVRDDKTGHTHVLDQYGNPCNPNAHYFGTGREIIEQTGGQLDYVVIGAGTGGTITGIAKAVKEALPNVKVIGVDPYGSILAGKGEEDKAGTSYQVEGIGYDFIPDVLDRSVVDHWVKVGDPEAFQAARMMHVEEGFLVGGSSGSAMAGAVKAYKELNMKPSDRVVVVLPDGIRNYMSKFANDDWMKGHGFEAGAPKARTTAPQDVPPNCDPSL